MFSYADIRRGEIALGLSDWYGLPFAPEEMILAWQTVGDVVRYIVAHADRSVTEVQALQWVQELFAFGWDIPPAEVAPEAQLFGATLRLDCRAFFRDYVPPPQTGGKP